MPEPLLSVRDLHVTYSSERGDVPAVRGVSFDLAPGETLGLAGESGCGKSTIAGALLRVLPRATSVTGEVLLDGEDVLTMRPGRLRAVRWTEMSIVFQGALHALNPVQRVGDQIAEAIELHRSAPNSKTRIGELLETVGIPGRRAGDYPHQLSGGQRQRVLIALALACNPRVLVADEPTTALDVMVQAQVLELLERLQRELALSMIFITHDLSTLSFVCQRTAVMYAGRIVEEGGALDVFDRPRHPYTAALAAAFPRIGDHTHRMSPSGLGGDPPDPRALPSGCPFHPRCAVAVGECPSTDVELWPAGDGRRAACVHVLDRLRRWRRDASCSRPAGCTCASPCARARRHAQSTASTSRCGAGRCSRSSASPAAGRRRSRARSWGSSDRRRAKWSTRARRFATTRASCAPTGEASRWSSRTRWDRSTRARRCTRPSRRGCGSRRCRETRRRGSARRSHGPACVRRSASSTCTRTSCRAASASGS